MITRWKTFVCWLLGHAFDAGVGIGWTGYVQRGCKRCDHTERVHHRALRR